MNITLYPFNYPLLAVLRSLDVYDAVKEIHYQGGQALAVGGWVRDTLRNEHPLDMDIEVYGIEPATLKDILSRFGSVDAVGESFGVLKFHGDTQYNNYVDFSIPRRESKQGLGHRGFEINSDPFMSIEEAARRRDLTINAVGLDLNTGDIFDPFHGMEDIYSRLLRATDPEHFIEDPLRVYRVAQFAARFEYKPVPNLIELCRTITPEGLAQERILAEFDKLLLMGKRPSLGLAFLRDCGWINYHQELAALISCEQDDEWHPEGDVWNHTLMVVDAAAKLRTNITEKDRLIMYGALCHDIGKAVATECVDGRIKAHDHAKVGTEIAERFMASLTRESGFITGVVKIVKDHFATRDLYGAGDKAIRRLARRLAPEVSIDTLIRVSQADYFGRGNRRDAEFVAGDWLRERAEKLLVQEKPEEPVLMGRHLIAAGMKPGPTFGKLLAEAYEIQTDEGIKDLDELMCRVGVRKEDQR